MLDRERGRKGVACPGGNGGAAPARTRPRWSRMDNQIKTYPGILARAGRILWHYIPRVAAAGPDGAGPARPIATLSHYGL